jgi:UPF0271 protein
MVLKLNCDLGEVVTTDGSSVEAIVMPHIDQANIACGFHAGSASLMRRTIELAGQHGVEVGAHPGYPDREGFGRRSMELSAKEIVALMHYQIAALEGVAQSADVTVSYVKPHGALYNDMMADVRIRTAIYDALASYHRPLSLMILATDQVDQHRAEAQSRGVELMAEAFADRCYDDNGALLPRHHPLAIHDRDKMLAQVAQLQGEGAVTTVSGKVLPLKVDSLCVHGDNTTGVEMIRVVRELIHS